MSFQNIVIFGNAGWQSDSCGNSSQQLALAFLHLSHRVLYVAPNRTPPARLREYSRELRSFSISPHLLKDVRKLLNDWGGNPGNTVFICSMATLDAKTLLHFFSDEHFEIIYRQVDWFSASEREHSYSAATAELACSVAKLIAISHPDLIEVLPVRKNRIVTITNGVNFNLFGSSLKEWKRPDDVIRGEITIGFWGSFWGGRLDWALVKMLADKHPAWEFHFIGDLKYLADQPVSLPRNVRFLGFKKKEELPSYLKHFDLCFIPYRDDRLFSKYCNPIKALESLAALKPIVTIRNRSLENYPGVFFYSCHEEAAQKIQAAAAEKLDGQMVLTFVRENTWEKKADLLLRELRNA